MSCAKMLGDLYLERKDRQQYIQELVLSLPFVARLEIIFKLDVGNPLRGFVIENLSDGERAIMNKSMNAIESVMKESEAPLEE